MGTPVTKEGQVQQIQGIIYAPVAGIKGTVKDLRFTNSASTPYTISLYFMVSGATARLLYSFTLDAGDVVVDDTEYFLSPTMNLSAKTNVATVNYVINVTEDPL